MKNCAEVAFSLTAILLAIFLAILCPDGLAQTQMVLVTTGSTMPAPLYVLWGDEYHKLHPETQLRYLANQRKCQPCSFRIRRRSWRR